MSFGSFRTSCIDMALDKLLLRSWRDEMVLGPASDSELSDRLGRSNEDLIVGVAVGESWMERGADSER